MADSSNTNGPLDRLEDALVRLTNQQLAMTQKIDEFLSRVSTIGIARIGHGNNNESTK